MPIWSNVILIFPVALFGLFEKGKALTTTFSVEPNNRNEVLMKEKVLYWKYWYILVVVVVAVVLVAVEATKRLITIGRHSMWITITCRCCL